MKPFSRLLRCCDCERRVRVGMGVVAVLCAQCARSGIGDRIKRLNEEIEKKKAKRASA